MEEAVMSFVRVVVRFWFAVSGAELLLQIVAWWLFEHTKHGRAAAAEYEREGDPVRYDVQMWAEMFALSMAAWVGLRLLGL